MSEFRIYKPRKDQNGKVVGAATSWQVNIKTEKSDKGKEYKELYVWLVGTVQKGTGDEENAVFDWKNERNPNGKQITMSLGDPDLGEMLALFNRKKDKLGSPGGSGLFHNNAKGNTVLSMEFMPSQDPKKFDDRYKLKLSSKTKEGLTVVEHALTLGEVEIIKSMIETALRVKHGPYPM